MALECLGLLWHTEIMAISQVISVNRWYSRIRGIDEMVKSGFQAIRSKYSRLWRNMGFIIRGDIWWFSGFGISGSRAWLRLFGCLRFRTRLIIIFYVNFFALFRVMNMVIISDYTELFTRPCPGIWSGSPGAQGRSGAVAGAFAYPRPARSPPDRRAWKRLS